MGRAVDVGWVKEESWLWLQPGLWCVIDAPLGWVSLAGLRPRRARRRFPSYREV